MGLGPALSLNMFLAMAVSFTAASFTAGRIVDDSRSTIVCSSADLSLVVNVVENFFRSDVRVIIYPYHNNESNELPVFDALSTALCAEQKQDSCQDSGLYRTGVKWNNVMHYVYLF